MNINFQTIAGNKKADDSFRTGMESDERIGMSAGKVSAASSSAFAVDLDTSIFSNDAYAQRARSLDDISKMAENTDVLTQHNYMALLSNTMSEKDYAKALEDGFDIKNLNSSETVTILDKIKSVLLESGEEIIGYNDDLSTQKLAKITGNESFAMAIKKSFSENDIPLTQENIRAVAGAYDQVSNISEPSDDAIKYMVLNNLRPTIGNLYFANHSTNGQSATGKGFYAQETGGYYAQKAEDYNWQQLEPQMDKVIEEAGLDTADESSKQNAKWMVIQGIPLTAENLISLSEIRNVDFPISDEAAANAMAAAISDGKKAFEGNLFDPTSNLEKAMKLVENTGKITDEAIKKTLTQGKDVNLKNLIDITNGQESSKNLFVVNEISENDPKLIQARLQLEEVRLKMTVEANKNLLDSGFSVDTAPMEQLIDKLKEMLGNIASASNDKNADTTPVVAGGNVVRMLSLTVSRVNIISRGPADVSGALVGEFETATLSKISSASENLAMKFKAAGQGYETMMTKPRSDLGDSMRKAFGNVDNILNDMGYETDEVNRRAVRILGYNSMEINEENFENVRAWDQKLKATIERLKPGAVLDLIREGKNPLNMTIEELSESLDNLMKDGENENGGNSKKGEEKYAKFLYKLEKKGDITSAEKASFIGIYRLFHTLKVTDHQAIGSILKTGRDMTIGNLLDATRTQKTSRRGLDYTVDDSFGGLGVKDSTSVKIDEQINSAFRFYSAQADIVYENLEPEKLMAAKPDNNTLLPDLANALLQEQIDEQLEKEYCEEQVRQIRQTAGNKGAEAALNEMNFYGVEVTYNNLEAMIANRRDRRTGNIWEKADELDNEEINDELKEVTDLLGEENYEEIYKEKLANVSEKMTDILMNPEDTYIDFRAITLMQKQMSVMSHNSERGSFEVPIEIDGSKVTMHITLKSDNSNISRMEASVQTFEYGLITASLYKQDGVINGMLTTTNSQSADEVEYLESLKKRMCEKLTEKVEEAGVDQTKIAILYNAQLQPTGVGTSANAMEGKTENITDTGTLLKMAKAFVEAI
ncbi:DUF6240 domain-containing protein [Butyrivibrio sp. INlla21]|uniref:DUF6240 domain-containing protein n=1 Tax=Butyrivibrio sp. INlla21 TaxID=1520811 RepID=UPI0008EF6310|nr:DUF6240 domain-containing protein [Butyrivibrio sp. INlla21]SFU62433.1 hypothetical protein SAMN02910342_01134 [Butyrivibrio sp. INlla21]